jgi:AraC-like DNA-binding protein
MDPLLQTVQFSVAVGVSLFGAVQLMQKTKNALQYYVATGFFALSYILLYFWAVENGLIRFLPVLVYSDIGATFVVAPAVYLSFVTIMSEGRAAARSHIRYFIVPFVVAGGILVHNILNHDWTVALVNSRFTHHTTIWVLLLSASSDICLFAYIALALLKARSLWKAGQVSKKREFFIIIGFLFILLLFAFFTVTSYIFERETQLITLSIVFGLIVLVYTLISFRIPDYTQHPAERKQTKGILLTDEESEAIRKRLAVLMTKEEIFRDPDLNLHTLAERVHVLPNTLSYYINFTEKANFREYLNRFRMNSVLKALVSRPDESILSIAFDNGFNSKSSFNSLFIKKHGISPREYRRRTLEEPDRLVRNK